MTLIVCSVLDSQADRPYVQAWLKRVDRELRGSGRVSQVALALSQHLGGSSEDWCNQLRAILTGQQQPTAELIADIDQVLAKPSHSQAAEPNTQGQLF